MALKKFQQSLQDDIQDLHALETDMQRGRKKGMALKQQQQRKKSGNGDSGDDVDYNHYNALLVNIGEKRVLLWLISLCEIGKWWIGKLIEVNSKQGKGTNTASTSRRGRGENPSAAEETARDSNAYNGHRNNDAVERREQYQHILSVLQDKHVIPASFCGPSSTTSASSLSPLTAYYFESFIHAMFPYLDLIDSMFG